MLELLVQMKRGSDGWFLNLGGMANRILVFSSFSWSLFWVIDDFYLKCNHG